MRALKRFVFQHLVGRVAVTSHRRINLGQVHGAGRDARQSLDGLDRGIVLTVQPLDRGGVQIEDRYERLYRTHPLHREEGVFQAADFGKQIAVKLQRIGIVRVQLERLEIALFCQREFSAP